MRRGFALTILALAILPLPSASAQETRTTSPATTQSIRVTLLDPELQSLDAKLRDIRDLSTRFTQEKHTALLRKPLTSSGTIRIKGQTMRWDTTHPAESVMLITPEGIQLYYPRQKLLEIYRLDQQMMRMAASPLPRLEVLKEHFDVTPGEGPIQPNEIKLTLTPRDPALQQHLQRINLDLNRDLGVLRVMEMIDADGDRTVIRFEDVKLNTGLRDEDLKLQLPPDTRRSYPMEGEAKPEDGR